MLFSGAAEPGGHDGVADAGFSDAVSEWGVCGAAGMDEERGGEKGVGGGEGGESIGRRGGAGGVCAGGGAVHRAEAGGGMCGLSFSSFSLCGSCFLVGMGNGADGAADFGEAVSGGDGLKREVAKG